MSGKYNCSGKIWWSHNKLPASVDFTEVNNIDVYSDSKINALTECGQKLRMYAHSASINRPGWKLKQIAKINNQNKSLI